MTVTALAAAASVRTEPISRAALTVRVGHEPTVPPILLFLMTSSPPISTPIPDVICFPWRRGQRSVSRGIW